MSRTPIIAGNWKLHKTRTEARAYVEELASALASKPAGCEVIVAPVATAIAAAAEAAAGSPIEIAGQNCHHEASGAFTGEVSPPLLLEAGAESCIIGHSERRQLFGETDDGVHAKLNALLEHGLRPIVCVGETLEQREMGETEEVVLGQVDAALGDLRAEALEPLVIAYEPIWAIGTGKTASPADAQEVHAAIRRRMAELLGRELADGLRVLYGGSVKPANAAELLAQPDIDGALVGGASLEVSSFEPIVRAARLGSEH